MEEGGVVEGVAILVHLKIIIGEIKFETTKDISLSIPTNEEKVLEKVTSREVMSIKTHLQEGVWMWIGCHSRTTYYNKNQVKDKT